MGTSAFMSVILVIMDLDAEKNVDVSPALM